MDLFTKIAENKIKEAIKKKDPENTQFSREFWEHFLHGYHQEHTLSKELIQQNSYLFKN